MVAFFKDSHIVQKETTVKMTNDRLVMVTIRMTGKIHARKCTSDDRHEWERIFSVKKLQRISHHFHDFDDRSLDEISSDGTITPSDANGPSELGTPNDDGQTTIVCEDGTIVSKLSSDETNSSFSENRFADSPQGDVYE